jgi:hypothetical protein
MRHGARWGDLGFVVGIGTGTGVNGPAFLEQGDGSKTRMEEDGGLMCLVFVSWRA